ncbi:MAG: lysylphosphatidylglycerol synthase transmembrane domain-containing protein, partial [Methanocella sp.]
MAGGGRWPLAVRAAISLGLLFWLGRSISWAELARALAGIGWPHVLAAAGWIAGSMVVSTAKWRLVLAALGFTPGWGELWEAYWAGLFANNFLPSSIGGDALRIWWAGRLIGDPAAAAVSVVVERVLAATGLALTGLAGAGILALFGAGPPGGVLKVAAGGFVLLAAGSLLATALAAPSRPPEWLMQREGRVAGFLKGLAGRAGRLKGQWGRLGLVVALSAVFQVVVVLVNLAILRALGVHGIGWAQALFLIPLTSIAAMLPLGVGGYGVREGAYVALLGLVGVARGKAFAASLL